MYTPVTTPVAASTLATAGLKLLQVPPTVPDVSAKLLPGHVAAAPVIAAGSGFTVTTVVVLQDVAPNVKVITAVPALIPVTPPDPPTVATAVLLLLHAPVLLVSRVVPPAHRVGVPPIAAGNGFMVTITVL
jgi:hypothetical protein